MAPAYPETPDGRYFVAKRRLWRKSDPRLEETERQELVDALMHARRDVGRAASDDEIRDARARVDGAKRALGERGPVWWSDAAPDESRRAPWNSSYAEWWSGLTDAARAPGL